MGPVHGRPYPNGPCALMSPVLASQTTDAEGDYSPSAFESLRVFLVRLVSLSCEADLRSALLTHHHAAFLHDLSPLHHERNLQQQRYVRYRVTLYRYQIRIAPRLDDA